MKLNLRSLVPQFRPLRSSRRGSELLRSLRSLLSRFQTFIGLKHHRRRFKTLRLPRRLRSRKALLIAGCFLLIVTPTLFILARQANKTAAAWWDDTWAYRQTVPITNAGSAQTNTQIKVFSNTDLSALVSAGKLQADLDDIRFTDINGKSIEYWIEDTTNNSVDIWALIPSIPASGATIYFYYGNPSAQAGKSKVGTQEFPGISCKAIRLSGATVNELYYIDPNGQEISDKYQVYCELTIDGGGWTTLIVNPAQNTTYNPLVDFGSVGNPQNGSYSIWSKRTQIAYTEILYKPSYESLKWASMTTAQPGYFKWTDASGNPYSRQAVYSTSIDVGRTNTYSTGCTDFTPSGAYGLVMYEQPQTWCTPNGTEVGFGLFSGDPRGCHRDGMKWSWGTTPGGNTVCPITSEWKSGYVLIGIRETTVSISQTPSVASPTNEEKSPGPIAYWKFDDGTGTTAQDSTANNNDGTLGVGTSAPTWQSEDMCISGKCLNFDGNDSVKLNTSSNANVIGDITVSTWIKPKSPESAGVIIHKDYQYTLLMNADKTVSWADSSNWSYANFGSHNIGIQSGKWNYVTVTKTGGVVKIYLNGIEKLSKSFGGSITSTSNTMFIGCYAAATACGANYFKGFIDEVKVYPYARTAAQIKADYAARGTSKGSAATLSGVEGSNLSNGLVGYWKMDEASGNAVDSSGNGNTGTANGTTVAAGKFGSGRRFNGTSDNVSISYTNPVTATSVVAWFKKTGTPNGDYHIITGGANVEISINQSGGGYIRTGVTTDTMGRQVFNSGSGLVDGNWHQVAMTYDGTNLKSFIDGSQTASNPVSGNLSGIAQEIGRYLSNSYVANGVIDEVRIYNRALSPKEVRDLYSWAPGPIAYYKLDEGSGTSSVNDSSGNGNTATMNGLTASDWTNGKFGKALQFNSTDYLSLNVNSWIRQAEYVTISGWYYHTGDTTSAPWGIMTNTAANEGDGFWWHIKYGGGPLYLRTEDNTHGESDGTGTAFISTGNWYHITTIIGTNKFDVYVNGVLYWSWTPNNSFSWSSINSDTAYFLIGRTYYNDSTAVNGKIDDVKLYNYARTPGQIIEDMNAGHPLGGSPVASQRNYWKFDEGYGTITYDSGFNGNNGTLGVGTSAPSWTNSGKIGKALSFDGTTDYVDIPNYAPDYESFTVTGWFNLDSSRSASSDPQPIFGNNQNTPFLGYAPSGKTFTHLRQYDVGSETETWTNSTNLADDNWHYVAMVVDQSSYIARLYLDGLSLGDKSFGTEGHTHSNGDFVNIGRDYASFFMGEIDEVKIYNTALTEDEIKLDYNHGSAMILGSEDPKTTTNDLILNLDATNSKSYPGSGATWYDLSGQGANATLYGTPYTTIDGHPTMDFSSAGKYAIQSSYTYDNDYTIEAFTKMLASSGTWRTLLRTTPNDHPVIVGTGGDLGMYDNNNGCSFCDSGYNITGGEWVHLVAVGSGSEATGTTTFYINGKKVGVSSRSVSGNLQDAIGGTNGGGQNWGWISIFRVYDRQLSQQEIQDNFQAQGGQFGINTDNTEPIAEWKMDEKTGGVAYDTSGNGNTASLTGGASWVTGKYGAGIDFDGSTGKGSRASFSFTSDNYTAELWVNPDTTQANYAMLFDYSHCTSNNWGLQQSASSTNQYYTFYRGTDGAWHDTAVTQLTANQWQHVVVVKNGTNLRIYVNGILKIDETETISTVQYSTQAFNIGNGCSDGRPFNGKIDQVKIYNYARSPAQIAYDYNRGGPVGHWKLDECQGTIANDASGNGNTGTITIGATGTNTSAGTCTGSTGQAWKDGATGKYNSSLEFDGTDDWIDLGTSTKLDIAGNNQYTLSSWIYRTSSGTQYVIDKQQTGFKGYYIYVNASEFCAGVPNGSSWNESCSSGASLALSTWTHILVTYDGSNQKFYKNGVLLNSPAISATLLNSTNNLNIARYNGAGYYFPGQIDDVRVYNYALTPTQIKTLYNENSSIRFGP